MRNQWEFNISHKSRLHLIKAEIIYESSQVQRIKIYGQKSYIILQNDFPFLQHTGKINTPVKWKLYKGELRDARLLTHIIYYLEEFIKDPDKNI